MVLFFGALISGCLCLPPAFLLPHSASSTRKSGMARIVRAEVQGGPNTEENVREEGTGGGKVERTMSGR